MVGIDVYPGQSRRHLDAHRTVAEQGLTSLTVIDDGSRIGQCSVALAVLATAAGARAHELVDHLCQTVDLVLQVRQEFLPVRLIPLEIVSAQAADEAFDADDGPF